MSFFGRRSSARNEQKRASLQLPGRGGTWCEAMDRGVPVRRHASDVQRPNPEPRRKRRGFFRRLWEKLTRKRLSAEEEDYFRRHSGATLTGRVKCRSLPHPSNVRCSNRCPDSCQLRRCPSLHLSSTTLFGYPSQGHVLGNAGQVNQSSRGSSSRSIASCGRPEAEADRQRPAQQVVFLCSQPKSYRRQGYVHIKESEEGTQQRPLPQNSPAGPSSSGVHLRALQTSSALSSCQGPRAGQPDIRSSVRTSGAGAASRRSARSSLPEVPSPEYWNCEVSDQPAVRPRRLSVQHDAPPRTSSSPERPGFGARRTQERTAQEVHERPRTTKPRIVSPSDPEEDPRPQLRNRQSRPRPRSAVLAAEQVQEPTLCSRCRSVVQLEALAPAVAVRLPPRSKEPVDVRLCGVVRQPKIRTLTEELYAISRYGWYWGPISRTEAEEKLRDQPDGAFLVRDSSDDFLVLSLYVRSVGKTLFVRIEYGNGKYSLHSRDVSKWHPSVVSLVEYSMKVSQFRAVCYTKPQAANALSYPVRLTRPVSRFSEVRSLQYLCRFVIRYSTRVDLIDKLPLPKMLIGYIEETCF